MAKHKTAQGKIIDLNEIMSKNEKIRAVGNMKVNARGDTIDSMGRVVEPVTNKVNKSYAKTVGNRSANVVRNRPANSTSNPVNKQQSKPSVTPKAVPKVELTESEKELENELMDDIEVEKIKAKENKNG